MYRIQVKHIYGFDCISGVSRLQGELLRRASRLPVEAQRRSVGPAEERQQHGAAFLLKSFVKVHLKIKLFKSKKVR